MANKYIKDLTLTTNPSLTGHTIFDNGIATYKTTLETLKDTIVDGVSHTFEGDQTINGNLTITGSLTAKEYIVSSSVTHVTTLAQSGSTIFGDTLNDVHRITGSVRVTGSLNLQGSINVQGAAIVKESLFVSGFQVIGTPTHHQGIDAEVLHVGSYDTFNIAHFNANHDNYSQVNIKNVNSGTTASSDLVLTADNGTEDMYYMNVGINSSGYGAGNVGSANDGYIINKGSDLYIGTLSGNTGHNNIRLYAAGNWQNPALTVFDNHAIGFNTETLNPTDKYAFSGNTTFRNEVNVEGSVTASFFVGDGSLLTNLPAGLDGTSGTSGINGTSGSSGISGTNGSSGTSGSSGSSGSNGSSGTSGFNGSSGTSGISGTDGSSGTSGSSGTDGTSGTSGDSIFAETGSFWSTTNDIQVTGSFNIDGPITATYFNSTDTGSAENYKVGDNVWLGDVGALNMLAVKGINDTGSGFIKFGLANNHQNPYIGHDSGEDANVLSVVADTTKFSNAVIVGNGSLVAGNPEMIHVYSSGSYNIANFVGNTETYSQINVKNINNNSGASSDIVVTADNGTEDIHYVNLGINSSGWEFQTSSIGYQNDSYLYNVGQDMYIGVMKPPSPSHGHLHLFSEGLWQNPSINIVESGSVAFNTDSVTSGYVYEFSGSMLLNHDLKVKGFVETSHIQGTGSFTIQPDVNDSRTIEIYNTSPSDIHIKGNAAYTFLGDDTNYVKIDSNNETITINSTSGTTINNLLKLNPITTLPTSSTFGDMAVSGSNLYFHNGTSWRKIQLEPSNNITVNNISGPIIGSFSATGVTFNESFPLSSGSTITGIGTIVPGDSLPMVISGNQNYLIQFYKNGSMILDTSGTGPSSIGFTSNFNITSNDNLEIRITTY